MPTTTDRAYRYPAGSAAPNVPLDLQNLATDVDADANRMRNGSRPSATTGRIGLMWMDSATSRMWICVVVSSTAYWAPMPGTLVGNLKQASAQSIPGDATVTALTWPTPEFDLLTGWVVGQPTRYTPNVPGWYEVSGGIGYASNATGYRASLVAKNGTTVTGSPIVLPQSGTNTVVPVRNTPVYCNGSSDYLTVCAYQNSGSAINTNASGGNHPSMTVTYLGVPV